MQNRWFIFILLFLMLTALFTLAFLQYKWLGSVSEAEKERILKEIAERERLAEEAKRKAEWKKLKDKAEQDE